MPTIQYKVLGQLNPGATTATTLYTCPNTAGNYAVVSTVTVCNRSSTPTSFRLWIAINAAGDDNVQYVAYDLPIAGNEHVGFTEGYTLGPNDLIRVYATLATLSFSAFGEEYS
jgi:hypothetical protein